MSACECVIAGKRTFHAIITNLAKAPSSFRDQSRPMLSDPHTFLYIPTYSRAFPVYTLKPCVSRISRYTRVSLIFANIQAYPIRRFRKATVAILNLRIPNPTPLTPKPSRPSEGFCKVAALYLFHSLYKGWSNPLPQNYYIVTSLLVNIPNTTFLYLEVGRAFI